MNPDDLTPAPDDSRELSHSELNKLVFRMLVRIKDLERREIVDTVNEHEKRLDQHSDTLAEHAEQLGELKKISVASNLLLQGIARKVDVSTETLGRIEAVLLGRATTP